MYRVMVALSMWGVLAATANAGAIPDVVVRYADAFAQTHPEPAKLPPGVTLREAYAKHFFNGFVHDAVGSLSRTPLVRDAYAQGARYWQAHPSERDRMFAGYGYAKVERDGVWRRGFEYNGFSPSDDDEENWWFTPLGADAWQAARSVPNDGTNRVHIAGYLSPRGDYGHLGGSRHEVLVTSITFIDAGNASSN